MQSEFSEIVKLGLDDPPQCGNEVRHYRFDVVVAAAVGVIAFLGTASLQKGEEERIRVREIFVLSSFDLIITTSTSDKECV